MHAYRNETSVRMVLERRLSLVYEGKEHEYFQIPISMWNSTLHTYCLHQQSLGSGCHFHICAHEHTPEARPQVLLHSCAFGSEYKTQAAYSNK